MKIKLCTFILLLIIINLVSSKKVTKSPKFEMSKYIKRFSREIGVYYHSLAAHSYCPSANIKNNKCCSNLVDGKKWKVHYTQEPTKKNKLRYSFLVSERYYKVVITFGYPFNIKKMRDTHWYAQSETLGGRGSLLQIVRKFYKIYNQNYRKVRSIAQKLYKKHSDYQFILVGHSIGGAVASVFAYDLTKNSYISKTDHSPLLITYGSPRVGNDIFSNETMKHLSNVFRVVRNGDPLVSLPACKTKYFGFGYCESNLPDSKFNKLYSPKSLKKGGFLPWHLGGMKIFRSAMEDFKNCGRRIGENNPNPGCLLKKKRNFNLNKFYFGVETQKTCIEK